MPSGSRTSYTAYLLDTMVGLFLLFPYNDIQDHNSSIQGFFGAGGVGAKDVLNYPEDSSYTHTHTHTFFHKNLELYIEI